MGIAKRRCGRAIQSVVVVTMGLASVWAGLWGLAPPGSDASSVAIGRASNHDVRSEHFARLASGQRGAVKWAIFTFRGPGTEGGSNPCIEEIDQIYRGFTSGTDCGPFAPPADEPTRTEFSTVLPTGKRGVEVPITIVGMVFGKRVRQVRLTMNSGPDVVRQARLLSATQAEKAHVRQFRFLAFDLGRRACVEAVTAFDAGGHEVLSTPRESCRPG